MKKYLLLLAVLPIAFAIAGCSKPADPAPVATNTPVPVATATPVPTTVPTAIPTATPIVYTVSYCVQSTNAEYLTVGYSDPNGVITTHLTSSDLTGNGWTKTVYLPKARVELTADYPDSNNPFINTTQADMDVQIWVNGVKVVDSGVITSTEQAPGYYMGSDHQSYDIP
jgi:hypothetical protein